MGLTRENLGPAARQHYDRQKAIQVQSVFQKQAASQKTKASVRSSQRAAMEFLNICEKAGLPAPVLEHKFHPTRNWRFDVAWPAFKLAIEIDGGVWVGGRHNASAGFVKDMEKFNSASILGWRILHTTPTHFLTYDTVDMVKRAMRARIG